MPISYAVCSECHDKFHNGDMSALQAYMSIDEVKDLLLYDNVYLACHGAYHLKLDNIKDNYSKAIEFKKDLLTAIEELRQYELNTSIYVFPYAYSRILNAHNMLFKCNFIHVFADEENKRIQIEDLKDE